MRNDKLEENPMDPWSEIKTQSLKFFADGVPCLFVILMLSSLPSVCMKAKINTINLANFSQ